MLETQRSDLMNFITAFVTDKSDEGTAYLSYLKDPSSMVNHTTLPPTFFVTGDEDMIQGDTMKLYGIYQEHQIKCDMKNYPKGTTHSLEHVFAVKYPDIPEAAEVRNLIADFWQSL